MIRVLHRGFGLGPYETLALTVPGLLCLAYLMHRFVERPFGPRLKRTMATQAAQLGARLGK